MDSHWQTASDYEAPLWRCIRLWPQLQTAPELEFWSRCACTVLALLIVLLLRQVPPYGVAVSVISDPRRNVLLPVDPKHGSLAELGLLSSLTSELAMQIFFWWRAGIRGAAVDGELRTAMQRWLSFAILACWVTIFVVSGQYGALEELGGSIAALIAAQLMGAGLVIMILDDWLAKGFGLGLGIPLFVAAAACQDMAWQAFSPSEFSKDAIRNSCSFVCSAIIFTAVIYLQGFDVRLPVKSGVARGISTEWHCKIFSNSFHPPLLYAALVSSVLSVSLVLDSSMDSSFLATWKISKDSGRQVLIGGAINYLSPPGSHHNFLDTAIHWMCYSMLVLCGIMFFSKVASAQPGRSAKDQAKTMLAHKLSLKGFRDSAVERHLKMYVEPGQWLAGFYTVFCVLLGDAVGAAGGGLGVVLTALVVGRCAELALYHGSLGRGPGSSSAVNGIDSCALLLVPIVLVFSLPLLALILFFFVGGSHEDSLDLSDPNKPDTVSKLLKVSTLMPWYLVPVAGGIKAVVTFSVLGFDLPLKPPPAPGMLDSLKALAKHFSSAAMIALVLNGYYQDLQKALAMGMSTQLFLVPVLSSNYMSALAIWGSFMIQAPGAALRLKPLYQCIPYPSSIAMPAYPGAAEWLPALKHIYALLLLPYLLQRYLFSVLITSLQQCLWCCTKTGCLISCGYAKASCLGCSSVLGVIFTLGMSSWARSCAMYWLQILLPFMSAFALQWWAFQSVDAFTWLYGLSRCMPTSEVSDGIALGRKSSMVGEGEEQRENPLYITPLQLDDEDILKMTALGHARLSLDFHVETDSDRSALLAVDGKSLRPGAPVAQDCRAEDAAPEDPLPEEDGLNKVRVAIVRQTLNVLLPVMAEQFVVVLAVRIWQAEGFSEYIGAFDRTINERSIYSFGLTLYTPLAHYANIVWHAVMHYIKAHKPLAQHYAKISWHAVLHYVDMLWNML